MTIKGIIKLDSTGLRVNLPEDFSRYYLWLITKAYYNTIRFDRSRHGTHLSIITQAIHAANFNKDYLKQYHNQIVELEYNPEDLIQGGSSKGFINFWFKIDFPLGDKIKKDLNVIENNFRGYHITIGNNKNESGYKK